MDCMVKARTRLTQQKSLMMCPIFNKKKVMGMTKK